MVDRGDASWKYIFLDLPVIVLYSERLIITVEPHDHTPMLVLMREEEGRKKDMEKEGRKSEGRQGNE